MVKRRDIFKIGAVAGVALAFPAQRLMASAAGVVPPAFTVPLPIPPVLDPVWSDEHGDHYELAVLPGTARILPGVDTRMLTYGGAFPGPTIKAVRGRPARVTVTNRVATPTAVHLHGGEVPQDSDGHPLDVIQPGGARIYRYPNHQPAAALWYHDHAHHHEAEQIYRGLSGFYLITDPARERWLPSGAYDIPLALRDAAFTDDGQLLWELGGFRRRNMVLVNGAVQPTHTVERRRYRLRFLNCANERDFRLRLGTTGFVQIGADGGLLPAPVRRTELVLSGAERADVIVDFSRFKSGSTLVLENRGGDADVNTNILRFVVAGGPVPDDSVVPATLSGTAAVPVLPKAEVTRRRVEFGFDLAKAQFLINGRSFDPHRVDFTIKQGATEIWEIYNNPNPVPVAHSLHLHLVQFRVLDRDGVPVESWAAYPKDTVAVHPGETVRILVRFHSRFTGRYPFHCHFVDHSSIGMMAQMEIIP